MTYCYLLFDSSMLAIRYLQNKMFNGRKHRILSLECWRRDVSRLGLLCIAAQDCIHKVYINGDMDVGTPSVQDLVCCNVHLHKEVASSAILSCCWSPFAIKLNSLPILNSCNIEIVRHKAWSGTHATILHNETHNEGARPTAGPDSWVLHLYEALLECSFPAVHHKGASFVSHEHRLHRIAITVTTRHRNAKLVNTSMHTLLWSQVFENRVQQARLPAVTYQVVC